MFVRDGVILLATSVWHGNLADDGLIDAQDITEVERIITELNRK